MIDEADASDSAEQRELEGPVLGRAVRQLGITGPLAFRRRIPLARRGGTAVVEVDGVVEDERPVYLEVYTSVGIPKSGQRRKLQADVLKLALLLRQQPEARAYVVVTSAEAEAFLAAGWMGTAMSDFEIGVCRVDLTPGEVERVSAAKARQRRGAARGT